MTRINVVPVEQLCDQHLLAEHRELTRIPNNIVNGKAIVKDIPPAYTLGTGHVKFFYDKLWWLNERYCDLQIECEHRGFNVKYIWPSEVDRYFPDTWGDFDVTQQATELNKQRIIERMPAKARWTNRERPVWAVKGE